MTFERLAWTSDIIWLSSSLSVTHTKPCGILDAVTDDHGWLTSAEAAAILDRSPQQARWLARHGHIDGEPVNGRWRFTATSVHAEAEDRARWISYEDAAALTGTDHHAVWRAAQAGDIERRQAHRANPALLRTSVEAWGAQAAAAEECRAAREAAASHPTTSTSGSARRSSRSCSAAPPPAST